MRGDIGHHLLRSHGKPFQAARRTRTFIRSQSGPHMRGVPQKGGECRCGDAHRKRTEGLTPAEYKQGGYRHEKHHDP